MMSSSVSHILFGEWLPSEKMLRLAFLGSVLEHILEHCNILVLVRYDKNEAVL